MDGKQKGMRERMLGGQLYIAEDAELARESARAQRLTHLINTMDPTDHRRRRDLPAGVVAVGSPARVVRAL